MSFKVFIMKSWGKRSGQNEKGVFRGPVQFICQLCALRPQPLSLPPGAVRPQELHKQLPVAIAQ